ncbi:hypothetical protein HYALB_00013115 [Hymenoscyphus albidus]|uniref:Uncharacterized protein n=1 Tax=Hymenoscyphus albidus TaxID=595503 RepID=A0A9N9LSK2_9HELO|nr:hypothetical protein HYALB_00013115 [Hymenoscyphus albidus]
MSSAPSRSDSILSGSSSILRRRSELQLRDLTDNDIDWFTQLLFIEKDQTMTKEWFKNQEKAAKEFPAQFLRSKISRGLSRVGSALNIVPQQAHLCKTHKVLNAKLIHLFFVLVVRECTIANASLVTDSLIGDLPEDVTAWIRRLHSLNGYWMSPQVYRAIFQHEPSYAPVEGGCEACILARIGGNAEALYDLEASAFTRRSKRRLEPRILKLLDGWMHERGMDDDKHPGYKKSLLLIQQIKKAKLRQQVFEARQKECESDLDKGKQPSSLQPMAPIPENVDEEENIEDDEDLIAIIDFYDYHRSTVSLERPPSESIHPALRGSSMAPRPGTASSVAGGAYDTQTSYVSPFRATAQRPTRPPPGPPPPAPQGNAFFDKLGAAGPSKRAVDDGNESEWTDDTVHTDLPVPVSSRFAKRAADRKVAADRTAEDRAQAYRDLVTRFLSSSSTIRPPPITGGSGNEEQPPVAATSKVTEWGDFYKDQ